MRRAHVVIRLALAVLVVVSLASPVAAQDAPPDNEPAVPSEGIVPKPNSGREPTEAGDRGGALQLLLPAVMVAAIGGGAWHISRQARSQRRSASQASRPSMKPER